MNIFQLLCWGFLILPIPLGILWVIVYRGRKDLVLPDWLSGVLAQGIISGHAVQSGNAKEKDYGFIIITTIILVISICLCISIFLPSTPADNSRINTIEIEHNTYEDNEIGMKIYVTFDVNNRKNMNCHAAAYFYFSSGEILKDFNDRFYTNEGQVAVGRSFSPSYDDSHYDNFTLFIPYDELHMSNGDYKLKFIVKLYEEDSKRFFAQSDYFNFTFSKH